MVPLDLRIRAALVIAQTQQRLPCNGVAHPPVWNRLKRWGHPLVAPVQRAMRLTANGVFRAPDMVRKSVRGQGRVLTS
jgi:hypothetical protein